MTREERRPWSCDTFVARRSRESVPTIFGKNSDRPARECQVLRYLPARTRSENLRLAYVEIEDAAETVPHMGSSPYWCWGHEMGMNTAGVVIGNEALFTRELAENVAASRQGNEPKPGILGMELVRLGLERATTAEDAVAVMTELLERHGQWGAGTIADDRVSAAYDNSYLIADKHDAWVLETLGRRWAARRVTESFWSLSNEPTIRQEWTLESPNLSEYLQERGWAVPGAVIDFADAVVDPLVPLQVSHIRLQRSRQLITETLKSKDCLDFGDARRILSDHYEGSFLDGPKFNAARPDFHTLCMHEHPAGFTWGNTAASMIGVLPANQQPYLWWAAATPCTSVYLPISPMSEQLPQALSHAGSAHGTGPTADQAALDGYDASSFWWQLQRLLEAAAGDDAGHSYLQRQPTIRSMFDELQATWVREADHLQHANADADQWTELTMQCADQASRAARDLLASFGAL